MGEITDLCGSPIPVWNQFPMNLLKTQRASQWRINMNIEKTEYCVFSRTGMIKDNISISLNRKSLKYNPTPKILGLTLDEKNMSLTLNRMGEITDLCGSPIPVWNQFPMNLLKTQRASL
jgi:hypothetical protein